jgi:protein TonB
MKVGFVAALAISTAIHAFLLWAVSADRRPIPLVTSGEICVECIASVSAEPRPLLKGVKEKTIKETAPENQAAQTAAESAAPVETPPKRKPDPVVPGKPPEKQSFPKLPVRETRGAGAPKDSVPLPSLSEKEPGEEALPVDTTQPPLPPPKPLDKPRTRERPAAPPPALVQEKKLAQVEPPASLKKPPDTSPQPPKEVKAPPLASSSPRQASPPSSPKTQGVKTEARLLGYQKPVYPREAQLRGLEGEVVISLEISAEGRAEKATLHKTSSHQILDNSALLFAKSLEFVPARQGRTPVPTHVLLPIRYRLVDPRKPSPRKPSRP